MARAAADFAIFAACAALVAAFTGNGSVSVGGAVAEASTRAETCSPASAPATETEARQTLQTNTEAAPPPSTAHIASYAAAERSGFAFWTSSRSFPAALAHFADDVEEHSTPAISRSHRSTWDRRALPAYWGSITEERR